MTEFGIFEYYPEKHEFTFIDFCTEESARTRLLECATLYTSKINPWLNIAHFDKNIDGGIICSKIVSIASFVFLFDLNQITIYRFEREPRCLSVSMRIDQLCIIRLCSLATGLQKYKKLMV